MSAALERIAIERLNDSNHDIASGAISMLQGYGSDAGEKALWRRFETWHDTWKDRVDKLKAVADGRQTDQQIWHERALVRALSHGTNWITGRAKLERLRTLCLTDPGRKEVDSLLEGWREPIAIRFNSGVDGEFPSAPLSGMISTSGRNIDDQWWVAQNFVDSLAELKKLLCRFPVGTTFGFPTGMLTDSVAEQRLFDDLKQTLAPHGMKLVKSQPCE